MHLMYFTEQPMSAYSEQAGRDFGATALMFPNTNFDPVAGSRLYNDYIEQYMLAEEVGVDGIMLNEHHNAPFCMQAKAKDRKSTRLNSSHANISYAVFCLKKKSDRTKLLPFLLTSMILHSISLPTEGWRSR